MSARIARRKFFKKLLAVSAFSGASILSFKRKIGDRIGKFGPIEAHAINNPDYAMDNFQNRIRIEYVGLSCFIITSSNGTKIITDPFLADKNILHNELKKETADIVTVSCGHLAHCYVSSIGGVPYIYQITEPTQLKGITFRGVVTRHLTMKEISIHDSSDNIIMCFEVDGIKICHLGALGHSLSDEQVRKIGEVDILMIPVGGVSTLPLDDANIVCNQLNPKVIFPMHYRSERCNIESWATVDEFVKDKKNIFRCDSNVGSSELEFMLAELPSMTQVVVPRFVY